MNSSNWFPGHIAKAINNFKDLSSKIDYFILLIDSRSPHSSYPNIISNIVPESKLIIFSTKCDLVDKKEIKNFYNNDEFFKNKRINFISLRGNPREKVFSILKRLKYKSAIKKIAVLGIPNVGKSSFINSLVSKKKQKSENRPGVTRNNIWVEMFDNYWILDSPGILQPKYEDRIDFLNLSLIGSINPKIINFEETFLYLQEILKAKNIETKFKTENIKEEVKKYIYDRNLNEDNFFESEIKKFQKLKYGKIIIEKSIKK